MNIKSLTNNKYLLINNTPLRLMAFLENNSSFSGTIYYYIKESSVTFQNGNITMFNKNIINEIKNPYIKSQPKTAQYEKINN